MATLTEPRCLHCLQPIRVKDNRRRNKLYCSDRCRVAAHRCNKRKRAMKIGAENGYG